MATPNYAYEKRQRELAKKRKKEEKQQRKTTGGPDTPDAPSDQDVPAPAAGEGTKPA